jgi:hypothetical protein
MLFPVVNYKLTPKASNMTLPGLTSIKKPNFFLHEEKEQI